MKKNLFNIYIFSVVMFSDFIMFAQPGDDSDPGDDPVEGDDAPQAPINGKLLWLAIVGILFAIYTYRNNKKEA
ncbi:MAG TPA: hypothetical protein VK623_09975 [Flavobacterium sp.]|nr:hypothetical protein [Flavobacterium sp.]